MRGLAVIGMSLCLVGAAAHELSPGQPAGVQKAQSGTPQVYFGLLVSGVGALIAISAGALNDNSATPATSG